MDFHYALNGLRDVYGYFVDDIQDSFRLLEQAVDVRCHFSGNITSSLINSDYCFR